MRVIPGQSSTGFAGNDAYFSGRVHIEHLAVPEDIAATLYRVSFEPAARTAWHTHPQGQILLITSGNGLVQAQGQAIRRVTVGDVVTFAPDEVHWHGAAPDCPMQHLAIQPDPNTNWMALVSDDEYRADAASE